MATSLRWRGGVPQGKGKDKVTSEDSLKPGLAFNKTGAPSEECIAPSQITLIAIYFVILIVMSTLAHHHVPSTKAANSTDRAEFSAERARGYLQGITKIGFRSAGTHENDVLTVNYLLNELKLIVNNARDDYQIDIDVQRPSGGFVLHFLSGAFGNAYSNITNVIAHIYPRTHKHIKDSVMVNAHFDSQMKTEGASDDAVSCAIMLEVLRALSRSPPDTIKYGVIFLFNGAEESVLEGGHGFVTQHPLAKRIKAFVNLEAAGSGGRELVFQTGPGHPWLVHTYASVAKYPYASVIAQEVFQSGVIPSDTDFRIFRDYGNLKGIDIAYASNGYVYHTHHDNAEIIPDGSVQRAGENVFAVVKALASSPYLSHSEKFKHGDIVFFDFLGLFMVLYPQRIGLIFNIGSVVIAMLYVIFKLTVKEDSRSGKERPSFSPSFTSTFLALLVSIVAWIAAAVVDLCIAYCLTKLEKSLSWYSHTLFAVLLYGAPALFVIVAVHHLGKSFLNKVHPRLPLSSQRLLLERSCVYSHLLLVSSIVIFVAYKGLLSAFLAVFWLVFPLIFHCFIGDRLITQRNGNKNFPQLMLLLHVMATWLPTLLTIYFIFAVYDVFIPIMGRFGSEVPPDFVIAGVTLMTVAVCTLYLISLVYLMKNIKPVLWTLGILTIIATILAGSGLVFPYSAKNPQTPKRLILQHVMRSFHDKNGNVIKSDAGVWLSPIDYLGMAPLKDLPVFKDVKITQCEGVYCGFPYYYPFRRLLRKTWYLNAPPPLKSPSHTFKVVSREQSSRRQQRIYFEIKGPNHMTLYVTTKDNVTATDWSITLEDPPFQSDYAGNLCHYVFYTHGYQADPWKFWIDFEYEDDNPSALADIALATHYLQGENSDTPAMKNIVNALPPWVVDTCWVSTFDQWVV